MIARNDEINLLLGMDAGFAPYYGVMLTSLLENNRNHSFNVYVLTDSSWIDKLTEKYERLLSAYHSRLFVYQVDEALISQCPLTPESHITLPTYYRLMAPSLLPDSIDRILYLDGDVIVNGDIMDLWNIDISEYAFAGVEDWAYLLSDNYLRLQYDKHYGYYNAGVTLYNLDYWRRNRVSERIFEYINTNSKRLKWLDQDAVNGFLHKSRYVLPIKYNFQVFFFMREFWDLYPEEFRSDVLKTASKPVIVHYNGHVKPCDIHFYGYPYYKLWRRFARRSPWHFGLIGGLSLDNMKFIIKRILFRDKALMMRNRDLVEPAYPLEVK